MEVLQKNGRWDYGGSWPGSCYTEGIFKADDLATKGGTVRWANSSKWSAVIKRVADPKEPEVTKYKLTVNANEGTWSLSESSPSFEYISRSFWGW